MVREMHVRFIMEEFGGRCEGWFVWWGVEVGACGRGGERGLAMLYSGGRIQMGIYGNRRRRD